MCVQEAPAEVSGGEDLTACAPRRYFVGWTNNTLSLEGDERKRKSPGRRKEAGNKVIPSHAHTGEQSAGYSSFGKPIQY